MWPALADELIAAQTRLARERPAPWTPPESGWLTGACFVCFPRGSSGPGHAGDPASAAATVARGRRVIATAVASGRAGAPYEPGLLALREGPLLEEVVRRLDPAPDVVLVNATGRDHPRCAGLALHLGAVVGIPTVGVTDRPLVAAGDPPGEARGARADLVVDGEVVGCWLRTRAGARPVAIHPGWRTDLETAVRIVLSCVRRARTPEPLRRARHLARMARAGQPP